MDSCFRLSGAGMRDCPREGLAMRVDMSEGTELTMPQAQSLVAKCRPRPSMVSLLSQLW